MKEAWKAISSDTIHYYSPREVFTSKFASSHDVILASALMYLKLQQVLSVSSMLQGFSTRIK
jgi:hypothetical protein